jgi:hypothetical protein
MPNSRSIPEYLWALARQRLVFFFAHRGMRNAEDLAHDTLAVVLRRDDYEFDKEEEFLKVCYGFANLVLKQARRQEIRCQHSELDEREIVPQFDAASLNPAETMVLLNEVICAGTTKLSERDWRIIKSNAAPDTQAASPNLDPAAANRTRVQLHRARKRLSRLIGWKKYL